MLEAAMSKPVKKLARIRLRLALCIGFGLLVSILSAFVPAIIGNVDHLGFEGSVYLIENPNPPDYLGDLIPEFRAAFWCAGLGSPHRWQDWMDRSISFDEYHYGSKYTNWFRPLHGDVPPGFTIRRGSYGFPFKCFYADEFFVASGEKRRTLLFLEKCRSQSRLRAGISISGFQTQGADRYLPAAPYWGGLALNTIIYGGLPILIFVLPAFVQRIHRRRDSLCLYCGYQIESQAQCPECGQSSSDQAAA